MSQNPHNNDDFFSDWDFLEPDWLKDESVSFTKETPPIPSAPEFPPESEPAAPLSSSGEDWSWENPAPTPEPVPKAPPRQPTAKRPRSAANNNWESDRSRSRAGAARRSSSAARARRPGERRSIVVIVLILALVLGMVFAGWKLFSILLGYQRDRSAYEELAANAILSAPSLAPAPTIDPNADPNVPVPTPEPTPNPEIPFQVDWDYLRSVNSDVIGWLYCPDTIINYPVAQTDNHDYYLNHTYSGDYSSSGTLFLDRNSVTGVTQSHMIIYGHNMKDGSMFGTLKHYVDKSYFDEHPIFYYLTPERCYRLEVISCRIVESYTTNFPTYFGTGSEYGNFLDKIASSSYWVNSDPISTDYQLMTFSTCTSSGSFSDPRLLVHAMMIPLE